MKLKDIEFIADENIDREVVQFLRQNGLVIKSASDPDLSRSLDEELLKLSFESNRGIITHDSDFGTLIFTQGKPYYVVLLLRPGHFDPSFTIGSLEKLIEADLDVFPPALITAKRSGDKITVWIKNYGSG